MEDLEEVWCRCQREREGELVESLREHEVEKLADIGGFTEPT
jgi:hypothetical protein